jgi:hypothetical protein
VQVREQAVKVETFKQVDNPSLGQAEPKEEVDQVDLPGPSWLLPVDTQQEGEHAYYQQSSQKALYPPRDAPRDLVEALL